MKNSFGIITDGNNDVYLNQVIDSIDALSIPNYEVIVVGNSKIERDNTTIIPFDETIKKAWITKKKNLITQHAKYDNVVYSHDYIKFDKDWYTGFLKFGNDFDLCMTKIVNPNETRYRDWCLCMWNDPRDESIFGHKNQLISDIVEPGMRCLLPYDEKRFTNHMYFSGAYWVAKKNVMMEFPLNDELVWGQGEDVIWSIGVRKKYQFKMNKYSKVKLLKHKDPIYNIADHSTIEELSKKLLK